MRLPEPRDAALGILLEILYCGALVVALFALTVLLGFLKV